MNILFVQDSSPCIRNIKYAEALQSSGASVHLLHKGKSPHQGYGRGDHFYKSITRFSRYFGIVGKVKKMVLDLRIDLIHFHNQPDTLCAKLIRSKPGVPVIYDCHDFMSFKHRLSRREKEAERICNEESDGVVYPAALYLREAMKHYNFVSRRLVFGNYFPQSQLLELADMAPKHSSKDGMTHLVYQGRLAEKKSDHRYIIPQLKQFDPGRFRIHLFPNNNKGFEDYKALEVVIFHEKLPYTELIKTISAMDYGLVMFQDTIAAKLSAIRYAFGNKTFDYLCAGLPILVQDSLDEIVQFVQSHEIGCLLSSLDDLPLSTEETYRRLVNAVLAIREEYSMEHRIRDLLDFYDQCRSDFHA
ncbi:MAG: glycosyltransferase [Candidatus Cloacimonadaceae bacterium]|nr:glycosyltransferase [Candidatus Cloacimonadaceae bacterium]